MDVLFSASWILTELLLSEGWKNSLLWPAVRPNATNLGQKRSNAKVSKDFTYMKTPIKQDIQKIYIQKKY